MDRIFLDQTSRQSYFESIAALISKSHNSFANELNISERTLRDWASGKYRFPVWFAEKIRNNFGLPLPGDSKIEDEQKIKAIAGRKGAIIRNSIYGNPGTMDGRKKGGLNSLKKHSVNKTGFKTLKEMATLLKSEELAEFIGIMIGDGGMTQNQIRVTLGLDEKEYSEGVKKIMGSITGWEPSLSVRKKNNTIEVVLAGRGLVQGLKRLGLLIGDKIKQGVRMPNWVMDKKSFVVAALRGMFDTDGSVYTDKHFRDRRIYSSVCIAFTSYSPVLLDDIGRSLYLLDFHPTNSTKNRIMLRRKEEVIRFFKTINPRNSKHLTRFTNFME